MKTRKELPGYGVGTVRLELTELDLLDSAELVRRLQAVFEADGYSPPRLPEVALKLIELSRQSGVDLRSVTRLLEADSLLAAELLKIAQSAQYSGGSGSPVRTLEEALLRLGLKRTGELFIQASLNMRVFRVKPYQKHMDELRRHSTTVAHLSRLISRKTSLFDEHAFLCGLLHDIGIAAALIAIADAGGTKKELPTFDELWPALNEGHGKAGGTLARLWKLPPEVAFVIEQHHSFIHSGYAHPTAAVIEIANAAAEGAGAGFGQESRPDLVDKALQSLGFSQSNLQEFTDQAAFLVQGLT
jgi:putative nucleotidyltransferase with HDIG domain